MVKRIRFYVTVNLLIDCFEQCVFCFLCQVIEVPKLMVAQPYRNWKDVK